mgnify:CR=1 FL=1
MLSRKEGSCRAIGESIAAGIPILVYKHHKGGAVNFVNEETGILSDYKELPENLLKMAKEYEKYKPRKWAEENTGYIKATERLNDLLKKIALRRAESWTEDIRYKVNIPHFVIKEVRKGCDRTCNYTAY